MAGKTKILVVDDESVIIDAANMILTAEGFAVRTVADAEGALNLIRSETPDIALIDLKLPRLSGMELLERVRLEFPQMVVIMMTGFSTLENAIAFLKNGAFDFLGKPFTFEELLSTALRASRFVALRASIGRTADEATHRYRLGMSSWAKPEPDGTVQLGITALFNQIVGRIDQIELPAINEELRQGGLLAQFVAQDDLKHTAWSALSGRVVAINPLLQKGGESLSICPLGNAWLVRIAPSNLETELTNLSAT
jgi:FixJ family two-component response regulator/glycine cleavage system H lipoate-binding protein